MNTLNILYHIARADYFERVRRYSFLVILALAAYLGYLVNSGELALQLGEYRGVYNSAWVGAMMALVTTTFVGLFGFYLVKNTLERDRQTGVGQIIAATPISKPIYLLGKWLSNALVLGNILVVLALAAAFLQLWAGEDPHLELWALLSPMLLVALPPLLFVAGVAVLFETLPGLRGGLGNFAYFMLFLTMIPLILENLPARLAALDPLGVMLFMYTMGDALGLVTAQGYQGDFSLGSSGAPVLHSFTWTGISWTAEMVLARLLWVLAGVGLVLLAALFFDRFSGRTAGTGRGWRLWPAQPEWAEGAAGGNEMRDEAPMGMAAPAPGLSAAQLAPVGRRFAFLAVLAGELRLLIKGRSKVWWLGLAGLQLLAAVSPAEEFSTLAGLAWIWPLLLWSGLGSRENQHRSAELVFSAPHALLGQLPAAWLAGALVTAAAGSGTGVYYLLAGDPAGLLVWLAAVAFIPALALACGIWSGGSKLFEVLYVVLWYLGPMNKMPALDYIGGPLSTGVQFAVLAAALLAVAAVGRLRQRGSF